MITPNLVGVLRFPEEQLRSSYVVPQRRTPRGMTAALPRRLIRTPDGPCTNAYAPHRSTSVCQPVPTRCRSVSTTRIPSATSDYFDVMVSQSLSGLFRAVTPVVVHSPALASSRPPQFSLGPETAPPQDTVADGPRSRSGSSLDVREDYRSTPRQRSASSRRHPRRAHSVGSVRPTLKRGLRSSSAVESRQLHLDMSTLHSAYLHSTLWMATSDGAIEVRSAAQPTSILSSIPKRTVRTIVTALAQIGCDRVVAGQSDGTLRLFDAHTLQGLREERAHSAAVSVMRVVLMPTASEGSTAYPRATVLLTASLDWSIAKWDGISLACLGRLQGSRVGVSALAGAVNGCYAYSGGEDGTLRMWNLLDNTHMGLSREEKQSLAAAPSTMHSKLPRSALQTPRRSPATRTLQFPPSSSSSTWEGSQGPSITTRHLFSTGGHVGSVAHPITLKTTSSRCHSQEPSVRASFTGRLPARGTATVKRKARKKIAVSSGLPDSSVLLERVEEYLSGHRLCCRRYALGHQTLIHVPPPPKPEDAPPFHWPIEGAHREAVLGLAVVEDCLLISASRDGTAKVFALPTGQFLHTLEIPRRVPLTGVILDSAQHRVLVGTSDGSIMGYDLRSADFQKVLNLRPPTMAFSAAYYPLRVGTQRRFFLTKSHLTPTAGEAGTRQFHSKNVGRHLPLETAPALDRTIVSVTAVIGCDRTAVTHDSSRSMVNHRVGEPSVCEVALAERLSVLQKQLVNSREELCAMKASGGVEYVKHKNVRACVRTMRQAHAAKMRRSFFDRWRRFLARRQLRPKRWRQVECLAAAQRVGLVRRYLQVWRTFSQVRLKELWTLQHECIVVRSTADDPERTTSVFAMGYSRGNHVSQLKYWAATAMAASREDVEFWRLLRETFVVWMTGVSTLRAERRREMAFNTLLLSFSSSQDATQSSMRGGVTRTSAHQADQEKVCRLLCSMQEATSSAHRLRRRYFDKWQSTARDAQERAAASEDWMLVEPLSTKLVRPAEVRVRYYQRWFQYSAFLSKQTRLREETRTLEREWLTLQNTVENPASVGELRAEELELETAIARTAFSREELKSAQKALQNDYALLRMSEALQQVLIGFPGCVMLSDEHANAEALRYGVSSLRATGCMNMMSLPTQESPSSQNKLLHQIRAVFCALKGITLQSTRDERQLAAAHELASQLLIRESTGLNDLCSSFDSINSGKNSHQPGTRHQRQSSGGMGAWSVNMTGRGTPGRLRSTHSGRETPHLGLRGSSSGSPRAQTGRPSASSMCLADAFDATGQQLYGVMCEAASGVGVDLDNSSNLLSLYPTLTTDTPTDARSEPSPPFVVPVPYGTAPTPSPSIERSSVGKSMAASSDRDNLQWLRNGGPEKFSTQRPAVPSGVSSGGLLRWVLYVPARLRREIMGHVVQLLVLFDSFNAHSDMSVEVSASMSTRGVTSVRPLPLSCLCSESTAHLLVRHATVLLELLQPRLWRRQQKLQGYADAYLLPDWVPYAEMWAAFKSIPQQPPTQASAPVAAKQEEVSESTHDSVPSFVSLPIPSISEGRARGQPLLQLSTLISATDSLTRRHSGPYHQAHSEASAVTFDELDDGSSCRHSFRSFSLVSTPWSMTPRSTYAQQTLPKPYLGFRVYVGRGSSGLPVISIKEVASCYINAYGEETTGPASEAGLRAGDVLVRFAGYAVTDLAAFNAVVTRHVRIGVDLPIVLQRDGEMVSTSITVGARQNHH